MQVDTEQQQFKTLVRREMQQQQQRENSIIYVDEQQGLLTALRAVHKSIRAECGGGGALGKVHVRRAIIITVHHAAVIH
jgi:hypothetical protein